MDKMERREVVLQWRRGRGEKVVLEWRSWRGEEVVCNAEEGEERAAAI